MPIETSRNTRNGVILQTERYLKCMWTYNILATAAEVAGSTLYRALFKRRFISGNARQEYFYSLPHFFHYMRPDLIRLLVDTKRKNLVAEEDRENGGVVYTQTIDRVGLSVPLPAPTNEPNDE